MRKLLPALLILLLASCASTPGSGRKGLFDSFEPGEEAVGYEQERSCSPLSAADRKRLLQIADPGNFPRTRYRRGPRRSVEKETDCSHFVHEIYRRAGLIYGFRTSRQLKDAPEFELIRERDAKPGDLMLFRGHVGIVDEDGRIISATQSRGKKSSITRMDREHFRPARVNRPVLRYRCRPLLRRIAGEKSAAGTQEQTASSLQP